MPLLQQFARSLALDLRSLAAFRICVAIVAIADLLVRFVDLDALFSDAGVLPRAALLDGMYTPWASSLYFTTGRTELLYFFLLAHVAAVFCLLIGYRTRLATFITWLLFTSLTARNPATTHGGDDLLRLLLFWSNFVPLGAFYSVDARTSPLAENKFSLLTLGTSALFLQFLAMYFWTAFLKLHPRWHSEGSAIYYALQMDQLIKPFGAILRLMPLEFLKALTIFTLWFELIAPYLVFVTWRRSLMRELVALAFIAFHFGLFLSFELGIFPWICMVGWVMVLPSRFWDRDLLLWGEFAEKIWQRIMAALIYFEQRLRYSGRFFARLVQFSHAEIPLLRLPSWQKIVVITLFPIAMYWNFALYKDDDKLDLPTPIFELGFIFRLHQQWLLFAPYPGVNDGWYVTKARLATGHDYDIWNEQPVDFSKPERIAPLFRSSAWRKYLMNLTKEEYKGYLLPFGQYLCRDWNQRHNPQDEVLYFTLYYMQEISPPPGAAPAPINRQVLWRHYCKEKPENWDDLAE